MDSLIIQIRLLKNALNDELQMYSRLQIGVAQNLEIIHKTLSMLVRLVLN